MTARASTKPTEPWRQRLIRGLLYGRNVDRAVKARARVGFTIIAFAAIYAVIGGRLVMFAIGPTPMARARPQPVMRSRPLAPTSSIVVARSLPPM